MNTDTHVSYGLNVNGSKPGDDTLARFVPDGKTSYTAGDVIETLLALDA